MGMLDQSVVGRKIIIGLTVLEHDGTLVEQRQMHGHIESLDEHMLTIRLSTGEPFTMPADDRAIRPAPAGTYRFRSTGEEIVNPELMATWIINRPRPQ